MLLEILKSMSGAVTDAMSIATAQTLGLQQLRREAAIDSVPRGSLTEEAKRKLRLSSFSSKLLFDGQVGAIHKENMAENQETLIRNAVSYHAKPNPSSSSPKSLRLSLARRRLNLRRLQRRTFPSLLLDPLKKDQPFGDLAPEVEVVAPPIEEPLPLRNTEVQAPLPLPLPNIPVGGRLAHFAQNWAEITDDKWVL